MIAAIARIVAPYALAGAAVIALAHFTPIVGYGAQLHRLGQDRDAWKAATKDWMASTEAWERSFRKSERFRVIERQASLAAVNDVQLQCDARVRQARKSAKVIRELVNAPVEMDADNCPLRGIIGADELRDALQPGPGS